jgi:hypothetical protein
MSDDATATVTYRWVDGITASPAEWDRIESLLAARGFMSLNRQSTIRILIAEVDGALVGFNVLQFIPHVGPQFVIPSQRGTGISDELADRMLEFLVEHEARGWVVVADNPISARLCRSRGMAQIQSPVFTTESASGV